MIGFKFRIIFVISIICKNVICNINVKEGKDVPEQRKENQKTILMTLTADCFRNGSILLILYTSEPFSGSIYSRSVPSICKTLGDGKSKRTKLFFNDPSECGVQLSRPKKV